MLAPKGAEQSPAQPSQRSASAALLSCFPPPSFRLSVLVVTQKRRSAANTTGKDSFALNPSPKYLSQLHVSTRTLKQRCPEVETDVYIGQGSAEHHRAKLRTDHHHRPPTPVNVAVVHVLLNKRLPPWGVALTMRLSLRHPLSGSLSFGVCLRAVFLFVPKVDVAVFCHFHAMPHVVVERHSFPRTKPMPFRVLGFSVWGELVRTTHRPMHIVGLLLCIPIRILSIMAFSGSGVPAEQQEMSGSSSNTQSQKSWKSPMSSGRRQVGGV